MTGPLVKCEDCARYTNYRCEVLYKYMMSMNFRHCKHFRDKTGPRSPQTTLEFKES